MRSKPVAPTQAYVWTWLPQATAPVVAGRVFVDVDGRYAFNYGRSYLAKKNAVPLFLPELPLEAGAIVATPGLRLAGCLRDASPDAWGRRVIENRLGVGLDVDELTFLLESGSDRIGALDFQELAARHVPRVAVEATLGQLHAAADLVDAGAPLPKALDSALRHGTSIGGARPKALLSDGRSANKLIAKFSSSSDVYSVVKAEFVAMRLARRCGLDVANVSLTRALGKDVLLIERFDRVAVAGAVDVWHRRAVVSALTLFGLDEMMARYASYEDLAECVRLRFTQPKQTLRELFARLVFNVVVGNTDDHARNHAAFWDGASLSLTPAFDICPQPRTGGVATQAMRIVGADASSQLSLCLRVAPQFLLSAREAEDIAVHVVAVVVAAYDAVCDEAGVSDVDRRNWRGRQFLHPDAFEGAPLRVRIAGQFPAE
jgi:serine/threonine-protein kinase HipA